MKNIFEIIIIMIKYQLDERYNNKKDLHCKPIIPHSGGPEGRLE